MEKESQDYLASRPPNLRFRPPVNSNVGPLARRIANAVNIAKMNKKQNTIKNWRRNVDSNAVLLPFFLVGCFISGAIQGHLQAKGLVTEGWKLVSIGHGLAFLILYPVYRWLSLYSWFNTAKKNRKLQQNMNGLMGAIFFAFVLLCMAIGVGYGIYTLAGALYSRVRYGDPFLFFS